MTKAPDAYRIAELEARLARLEAESRASRDAPARLDAQIPVRLARTVAPDGGSYPAASSNPNTYPIIFLDGTYTRTAGNQTPTWTDRQAVARAVVFDLASETSDQAVYIPEDTVLAVWWKNNRWWTRSSAANIFPVTLAGTVASGASTSVTLPDGRSVTATNQTTASLNAGRATAYRGTSDGNWYLTGAGTGGGSDPVLIEGYVYASFTKTTPEFLVKVTHDDAGLLAADTQVTVQNFATPSGATPYLFEGEFGKACFFRRDVLDSVYRSIWVVCPENSPVQVSPPYVPGGGLASSLYNYGGMAASDLAPYYEV